MSPAQLLIVEDDKNLRLTLADNLAEAGHAVSVASTVAEARLRLSAQRFELIVLDVMLPDGDGYSLCRELRASGVATPVLMLTARTLEDDLVRGFEAGAEDYLGKPYRLRELHARIGALLRRAERPPEAEISFGGFRLDPRRRQVHAPDGSPVELTRKEFDLLAYLLANRDRALTRDALLDAVWGEGRDRRRAHRRQLRLQPEEEARSPGRDRLRDPHAARGRVPDGGRSACRALSSPPRGRRDVSKRAHGLLLATRRPARSEEDSETPVVGL